MYNPGQDFVFRIQNIVLQLSILKVLSITVLGITDIGNEFYDKNFY